MEHSVNDALPPPWILTTVGFTGVMGSTRIKQRFLEQEEDHFSWLSFPDLPPWGNSNPCKLRQHQEAHVGLPWWFSGKENQPASAEDMDSIRDVARAYMLWSN